LRGGEGPTTPLLIAFGSMSKSLSFLSVMPRKVEDIVARLAAEKRVVVMGALAVIAHGLLRATKDADVWLDCMA